VIIRCWVTDRYWLMGGAGLWGCRGTKDNRRMRRGFLAYHRWRMSDRRDHHGRLASSGRLGHHDLVRHRVWLWRY
jgi:hypothetical protein